MIVFPLDFRCSLLEQLNINAKKYALHILKGLFLDAKTFGLKIDRIGNGRRFAPEETAHGRFTLNRACRWPQWVLGHLQCNGFDGGLF